MAEYTNGFGFSIGEEEVHLATGKHSCSSLLAILPGYFRHSTEAFENFARESIRFRCKYNPKVSRVALRLLQTIFEALQNVTTPTRELNLFVPVRSLPFCWRRRSRRTTRPRMTNHVTACSNGFGLLDYNLPV
jgi:hypothetical protein